MSTLAADYDGHWAAPHIDEARERGWMTGYPDGSFKPDNSITRAEFSVMLWRAMDSPAPQGGSPFTDVDGGSWYGKAVTALFEAGIVTGYGGGTFAPGDTLTREMGFVMLARAFGLAPEDAEAYAAFTDGGDTSDWARDAASALIEGGYVEGADGKLLPKKALTRGEMAKLLIAVFDGEGGPIITLTQSPTTSTTGSVAVTVSVQSAKVVSFIGWRTSSSGASYTDKTGFTDITAAGKFSVSSSGWYAACAVDADGNFAFKLIQVTNIQTSGGGAAYYTVTMQNDGHGTAAASLTSAARGATITITATPTGDYVFKQWTVISGGVTLSSTTTNPAMFTMGTEAVEIKAEFEAVSRTVTMTDDGRGTAVAIPADATAGTEVTITATPTVDYAFKQWTVVSGGITLSSTTTNPATFTMGSEAVEIKAEFFMSADAVAQATILAYNAGESAGANTVYTFALPAAAPGATIATVSATCNGSNVTSSLSGIGSINLVFSDAVLAALPYDKDLAVTYTVTYGGQTSSAVTTHIILATEIAAKADITAARKATANAEAAKITGFMAVSNTYSSLEFIPIVSSALNGNAAVNFVSVKTGAVSPGAVTDLGADITTTGFLSLSTQKTVDAADLTYVSVTFTVTLNGVTSDERTLVISSLFASGTTAGKLRTDKAKFPTNGSTIGSYTFTNGTTSLDTYYSFSSPVPLSNGVAFSPVIGTAVSDIGIDAHQLSLKAEAGGDIRIAFAEAPTREGDCSWHRDIVLTCDGTSYSCSGINFLVKIYVQS